MKILLKMICALFLAGLVGCGTPRNNQSAEKTWPLLNPMTFNHAYYISLYEAGLRSEYCLADEHVDKTDCYLSVGWDNEQEVYIDPPEELFQILADMKLVLKPVSTLPGNKRGENVHMVDEQGKGRSIYIVQIRNAIDDNTVEIEMGHVTGSTVITTARRTQDGKWRFDPPFAILH